MLALVIDTSSAAVTAGIVSITAPPEGSPPDGQAPDGQAAPPVGAASIVTVLAERVTVDARAHGERLAPSVKACLDEAGVRLPELDAVIAGVGPGPFTGLRVGLVTAAAIADAVGLRTYGVCSLDAIAAAHPGVASLLVAGDARRKEVYWARYVDGARQGEPAVAKPADVALTVSAASTAATSNTSAMVGAGARLYEQALNLPLLDGDFPTVTGLAEVAAAGRVLARAASDVLVPLYLRRPDAVASTTRKLVSQ